eukprot:TRINITY_DN6241_c0_g1_i1.p1 TRINITY_DN6241_c0_g1~~TRINITY_DN6241_c0_g1_i1.p1  ORF type:complete len:223 (-),score=41.38 TRINITY_DN6241_c0_g1_i1:28-696(-)
MAIQSSEEVEHKLREDYEHRYLRLQRKYFTPEPPVDDPHLLHLLKKRRQEKRFTKEELNLIRPGPRFDFGAWLRSDPTIPVEVRNGQKSFEQWTLEMQDDFRKNTRWFNYQDGHWVQEIPPNLTWKKGYCPQIPHEDPKWEEECRRCRILGTIVYGGSGTWMMLQRLHYERGHPSRKFFTIMGYSLLFHSGLRAFDYTFFDLRMMFWQWFYDYKPGAGVDGW